MRRATIGIGLIGPGLVGSSFLDQVAHQAEFLKDKLGLELKLLGIANSSRMVVSDGVNMRVWREAFQKEAQPCDMDLFVSRLLKNQAHIVLVDSTSSENIPNKYAEWMLAGCHVITPNKKLGSGSWERYMLVANSREKTGSRFFYEATVGAGLPVISSLQSLRDTGDRVHKIFGVFSGTLSYIFNNLSKTYTFSSVVQDAMSKGFTEPDPRDDLSGLDVARKVIVLARECGLKIELDDLNIQNLVPDDLLDASPVDVFMKKLTKLDDEFSDQVKDAAEASCVLRYVGVVDVANEICEVGLKRYPSNHPLAQLSGTENIVCFETQRYDSVPLVVKGPGAGAEVTAMGVFSDLVELSKQLSGQTSIS